MEYKYLEEINKRLKTIDVKGKNYVEVNERIKAFWELCPDGKIHTNILNLQDGICVIQAVIFENKTDTEPRATGIAYEKEGSTFINKTSYIENCETSAVGRALGNAGIGIDTSVASAEEVQNAILQQNETKEDDELITETQIQALYELIRSKKIKKEYVLEILKTKGYTKLANIKMKDYMTLVKIFESIKGSDE